MRVINANKMRELLSLLLAIGVFGLLGFSIACGPTSQVGQDSGSSGSGGTPELTEDVIRERINDAVVRNVPEENGTGDPISWNFDADEPKEMQVIDRQVNGPQATIVLDIKTSSSPRARNPRKLAGQIRTEWRLETGWVLRRWEIVRTENISMKYENLPKPAQQNSNH